MALVVSLIVSLSVLAAPPSNSDLEKRVNEGRAATKAKAWEAAVEAFTQAIVLDPNDARALGGRGYAHLLAGHLSLARRDLQAVVDAEPPMGTAAQRSAVWFNLSLVAVAEGAPDQGLFELVQAEILHPNKTLRAKIDGLVVMAKPYAERPSVQGERVELVVDRAVLCDTLDEAAAQVFASEPAGRSGAKRLQRRVCLGACKGGPWLAVDVPAAGDAVALVRREDGFAPIDITMPEPGDTHCSECGKPQRESALRKVGPLYQAWFRVTDVWAGRINEDDEPNCQPAHSFERSVYFDAQGTVLLRYDGGAAIGVGSDGRTFVFGDEHGLFRATAAEK